MNILLFSHCFQVHGSDVTGVWTLQAGDSAMETVKGAGAEITWQTRSEDDIPDFHLPTAVAMGVCSFEGGSNQLRSPRMSSMAVHSLLCVQRLMPQRHACLHAVVADALHW